MCSQKKLYVLDRREGNIAVLIGDGGDEIKAPGLNGREGDVFERLGGELIPRPEERGAREARIRSKMDTLFKKREK